MKGYPKRTASVILQGEHAGENAPDHDKDAGIDCEDDQPRQKKVRLVCIAS